MRAGNSSSLASDRNTMRSGSKLPDEINTFHHIYIIIIVNKSPKLFFWVHIFAVKLGSCLKFYCPLNNIENEITICLLGSIRMIRDAQT